MTLPLKGIRVVDFSNFVPGPYCTMIMADLGAEVVKIERPDLGDPTRVIFSDRMFEALNRNKKSVTANLKNKDDLERVKSIIRRSDVLVEGFRPGVMDRLGLGYEAVRAINGKIIYVSISGYGQTGPYRHVAGHDINYLAISGVLGISGDPSGPPAPWGGVQVADFSAAMYAAVAILAALRRRDQDGRGDYIDISITDCAFSWMSLRIAEYFAKNRPPKNVFMGRGAYGAFATKDGKYIAIGCLEDVFFRNLCDALGLPELKEKEEYRTWPLRCANYRELNAALERKFAEKTFAEWMDILANYDVPCSHVNRIDDLVHEPVFRERGLIETYGGNPEEDFFIRFPAIFRNTELNGLRRAPGLGEHNLGWSDQ